MAMPSETKEQYSSDEDEDSGQPMGSLTSLLPTVIPHVVPHLIAHYGPSGQFDYKCQYCDHDLVGGTVTMGEHGGITHNAVCNLCGKKDQIRWKPKHSQLLMDKLFNTPQGRVLVAAHQPIHKMTGEGWGTTLKDIAKEALKLFGPTIAEQIKDKVIPEVVDYTIQKIKRKKHPEGEGGSLSGVGVPAEESEDGDGFSSGPDEEQFDRQGGGEISSVKERAYKATIKDLKRQIARLHKYKAKDDLYREKLELRRKKEELRREADELRKKTSEYNATKKQVIKQTGEIRREEAKVETPKKDEPKVSVEVFDEDAVLPREETLKKLEKQHSNRQPKGVSEEKIKKDFEAIKPKLEETIRKHPDRPINITGASLVNVGGKIKDLGGSLSDGDSSGGESELESSDLEQVTETDDSDDEGVGSSNASVSEPVVPPTGTGLSTPPATPQKPKRDVKVIQAVIPPAVPDVKPKKSHKADPALKDKVKKHVIYTSTLLGQKANQMYIRDQTIGKGIAKKVAREAYKKADDAFKNPWRKKALEWLIKAHPERKESFEEAYEKLINRPPKNTEEEAEE